MKSLSNITHLVNCSAQENTQICWVPKKVFFPFQFCMSHGLQSTIGPGFEVSFIVGWRLAKGQLHFPELQFCPLMMLWASRNMSVFI